MFRLIGGEVDLFYAGLHDYTRLMARFAPKMINPKSLRIRGGYRKPSRILLQCNIYGLPLGYIRFDLKENFILWRRFYPTGEEPIAERKGIGTAAHIRSLEFLLDRLNLPDDMQITHEWVKISKSRKDHLKNMGIDKAMTIKESHDRAVDYAIKKGITLS